MIVMIAWRGGEQAKSRLTGTLTPGERAWVSESMFRKVSRITRESCRSASLWIVSPTHPPTDHDRWVKDSNEGLNAAIELALGEAPDGEPILILPADLPILTHETMNQLCTITNSGSGLIGPDKFRQGTNALGIPDRKIIRPEFGEGSYRKHHTQLLLQRLSIVEIIARDIASDLDTCTDFEAVPGEIWSAMNVN